MSHKQQIRKLRLCKWEYWDEKRSEQISAHTGVSCDKWLNFPLMCWFYSREIMIVFQMMIYVVDANLWYLWTPRLSGTANRLSTIPECYHQAILNEPSMFQWWSFFFFQKVFTHKKNLSSTHYLWLLFSELFVSKILIKLSASLSCML